AKHYLPSSTKLSTPVFNYTLTNLKKGGKKKHILPFHLHSPSHAGRMCMVSSANRGTALGTTSLLHRHATLANGELPILSATGERKREGRRRIHWHEPV